ncbi:iron ABC transporter permease [Yoonia sp. I 8.24]|uniref:FecCD family ABC transporter permease n=1 Tax=Yoonia sp. I 8.24 TaxID=1537229 RepID=UPI001EE09CEF|nr:iron ABC transporter permease [Yoonia sp. I 8.24]MCG3268325.1 iron ABC transporter permease [Yoonia sp. I 8.24]
MVAIDVNSESARSHAPRHAGDRRSRAIAVIWFCAAALGLMMVASLTFGASGTSLLKALVSWASGETISARDHIILFDIRAPRTVLGALIGASLAVSGAVMQGLFRNPLADPGLVGVSAGASLGAILAIVLGGLLPPALAAMTGNYTVSIAAFIGGWLTTILLYRVATSGGRTSVAVMLLAGIAMGALAGAISGMMIYLADDQQLRDLTFWGLGSLAGATWNKLMIAGPLIVLSMAALPFLTRGLDALTLGEATAGHLGIPVQRMKNIAILTVAGATGAAVAVSGGIGFVGIVVPHLLRLLIGPSHRYLLPASALLGGALLLGADIISRTIVAPSELPIGIVTATIGGPFFLFILLRNRNILDM